MVNWSEVKGFQWDTGNITKNFEKHNVTVGEAEQVFFNEPLLIVPAEGVYNGVESRYLVAGITDEGRKLTVVFTVRENYIRVISARDMSRKERKRYDKKTEENS